MKRALIVSNSSGLVTLFLKNDVEILKSNGYEIDCACNTNYPDNNTEEFFKHYAINVYHVDFPIRNIELTSIFHSYIELKQIMQKINYDVVHCHSTIAAVIGRQCSKKYRKNGLKVLYTSHGFPFYDGNNGKKARIFFAIENYYSKFTDAIITICKEDYENAKKMYCANVRLMHGVGVDVSKFINCKIDRNEYRKLLGFSSTDKVILSVGELNTNKNHKVVIEAISLINNKDIVYAICGREVTEKGKKVELEELANQLNVRICFLGFRKDIPEICHIADIGALPSLKEGLGLSGIEMLASGIPVVGSNRQGIKDYVIDGVTGYLADPEDKYCFSEAINKTFKLTNDGETARNCRKTSTLFSCEQAYDTIKKTYDTMSV